VYTRKKCVPCTDNILKRFFVVHLFKKLGRRLFERRNEFKTKIFRFNYFGGTSDRIVESLV